jgi:peroxiredoxin
VAQTSTAFSVGKEEMPVFKLPDEEGRPFNLAEQLEEGPLVLVFYRED